MPYIRPIGGERGFGGSELSLVEIAAQKLGFTFHVDGEDVTLKWDEDKRQWEGVVPNVRVSVYCIGEIESAFAL